MSKIPYTVNVDEYVCTELSHMRKMHETHDYSGLLAAIERVQIHVNAMENALYANEKLKSTCKSYVDDKKKTDKDFRKLIKEELKDRKE